MSHKEIIVVKLPNNGLTTRNFRKCINYLHTSKTVNKFCDCSHKTAELCFVCDINKS